MGGVIQGQITPLVFLMGDVFVLFRILQIYMAAISVYIVPLVILSSANQPRGLDTYSTTNSVFEIRHIFKQTRKLSDIPAD